MIDDATRTMAAREAAWDPLRERRVLGRVEAELDRQRHRTVGRRRVVLAAVALAALLIAVLSWPVRDGAEGVTALVPDAPVESTPMVALAEPPAIPELSRAAIALGDGSIATLHDGARIGLRTSSATAIEIEQSVGRVHYEVRPGLPRSFAVVAADIRVVVVGTAFWVTREADAVRVTVEHGRVEIHRSAPPRPDATTGALAAEAPSVRVAELGAGDELRVGLGSVVVEPTAAATSPARPPRTPTASPRPRKVTATRRDVATLLGVADAARGRGDLIAAAAVLREIVEAHDEDPRAYGSAFQLGKVERARGRHADAARAFAAAARHSPAGALTDDARAEAAVSWFDAGDTDAAARAAADYLTRHPDGVHAARVERMLARIP